MNTRLLSAGLLTVALTFVANTSFAARCLLVMSYHQGYAWNDGVENGVKRILQGKCELNVFYMDTKRNKEEAFAKQKALQAKKLIEQYKPDVVIASDDNASRYLVQPYFKNSETPIVFCAVNWTAKKYGYPYDNVTGMIEVAPIQPMLEVVKHTIKQHRNAVYIGAKTFTEQKNYKRFREIYGAQGINVDVMYANSIQDWKQKYLMAQTYDFIILGSNAGINDWNEKDIMAFATSHAEKLTVSNHHWMSPYTMYSITKIPEEQGEWSAEVALKILQGVKPRHIPITPNRKWDVYINTSIANKAGITIPVHGTEKFVKLEQ